ncbi:MAG: carboxypeptidase-like regulatory domain-containing protein, partial [Bacteroidota bacterium]
MKKNYAFFIFCITLLYATLSFGQQLEGYVFDQKTQKPLTGVSIYFDGTTIGTSTDSNGRFMISYEESTNSPLVVSFIGYNTQLLDVRKQEQGVKIYLTLRPQALGTVYLVNDPWSRQKKMEIFKREFLGTTVERYKCRILNLDEIELIYNPET